MEQEAEPGTPENPLTLTDPRAIRALAHPARIAIWTHLGVRGPATATECAEVAGLSPSACSYHLRALARYGFVAEDPDSAADGRQRPWRARVVALHIDKVAGNPAAVVASQFLAENFLMSMEDTRARYLSRRTEYPADWQRVAGDNQDVVHVAPAELEELRSRVTALVSEYRRLDPADRPAGTLPVRVGLSLFPWFGPEEAT